MRRDKIPQVLVWASCLILLFIISGADPCLAKTGGPFLENTPEIESQDGPLDLAGGDDSSLGDGLPNLDLGDDDDYWDEIHWGSDQALDVGLFPKSQVMFNCIRIMIGWRLL